MSKALPSHFLSRMVLELCTMTLWSSSYELFEGNLKFSSVARLLGRSVAGCLAQSLDRSIARSLGRSLARPLGRSVAQSLDRSLDRSLKLANYFGGSIFGLQICRGTIYEVRCSIEIVKELGSNCFIVLGSRPYLCFMKKINKIKPTRLRKLVKMRLGCRLIGTKTLELLKSELLPSAWC